MSPNSLADLYVTPKLHQSARMLSNNKEQHIKDKVVKGAEMEIKNRNNNKERTDTYGSIFATICMTNWNITLVIPVHRNTTVLKRRINT